MTITKYKLIPSAAFLGLVLSLTVFGQIAKEKLSVNQPAERQIKGGETQTFEVKLEKNEFARVEVVPTQINVVVSLIDGDGKTIIEMDGDPTYLWRESVSAIAEINGTFKLQVKGKGNADEVGSYTVKLAELRQSTAIDRKRIEAEKQLVQANKLNSEDKIPESIKLYESSLDLWRESGDKHWEAITLWNLAFAYHFSANYQYSETDDKPLKLFNQALSLFQNLNDRVGEASTFQGIGSIYRFAKKYDLAKENLEKGLNIRKQLKRLRSEFNSLNLLILVYYNLKQNDKVLESQNRMSAIGDELNDKALKADTLKASGQFHLDIQRYADAVYFYEKALPVYQELKDAKNEIFLRSFLGLMYGQIGEYEKAKIHLERYAELMNESKQTGDWNVYQHLGLLYEALQQYDKAFSNYEKALNLAKMVKDERLSEGRMLSYLGGFYTNRGEYEKAKKYLEESLQIQKTLKSQSFAYVLSNLADLYLKLKDFEKAEDYSEQTLAIKRTENKYEEAFSLNYNGLIYLNTGKYEKAQERFKEGFEISREIENKRLEADNLNNLGLTFVFLQQFEEAKKYYSDALIISRQLNNQRMILTSLNGLASANNSLNNFEEAGKIYEDVIKIAGTLQTRREIATAYNSLGNVYINLGEYEKARQKAQEALQIAQDTKESQTEAAALINLGKIHSYFSQYDEASKHFEKVLKLASDTKNIFAEYDAVTGLGFVYLNVGKYDKAKESLEKAEKISKQIKLINNVDIAFALGAIYTDLNKQDTATTYLQQSLESVRDAKNRRGEGIILGKLAEVYLQQKQYEKAKEIYEKSLVLAQDVKNVAGESTALINLGEVYLNLDKFSDAQSFYERGLDLARKIKNPSSEGSALNGLGKLFFKQKQYDKAQSFYRQALPIAKKVQIKKFESEVLKNLMELYKELKTPEIAVAYGKQSINIYQEIRGNIKNFEKDSQQSYVKDKEAAYRTLADLLIAEDRFFEAQSVLNLLKEEEYFQLSRTGDKGETIPYSDLETALLESSAQLAALQNEYDELQKIENPNDEQLRQLGEKRREKDSAKIAFDGILKKLAVTETSVKDQINRIYENKGNNSFQSRVKNLQTDTTGVVGLYTLIGREENADNKNARNEKNKFGWVILIAGDIQRAYPIDVDNFNQNVFDLRDALSSDKYDPQPLAGKIYNAIFRQKSPKTKTTLEQDLQRILGQYPNKTLMWSLDGVLRYIPMAALHDGKSYLVEKYLNTVFTDKSISSLTASNSTDWKVLGVGISESRENFAALPGVKTELETIVREESSSRGIINGTIRIDGNFKKELFFKLLKDNKYQVVHIASHYSFNPAQQQNSFLLVGDGHLVFSELIDDALFGNVDLLTLSACDTGATGNGKETESFPLKAQELGAKSVIASLWKISDAGTPELMVRFYKLRVEHPELAKGFAFRQAQLALLKTNAESDSLKINRSELAVADSLKVNLPLFKKDESRPFAHPYYWSPFILIGNWK